MFKLPGTNRYRKGKPSAEDIRRVQREKRLENQRMSRWQSRRIFSVFSFYADFAEEDVLTKPQDLQSIDALLNSMRSLAVSPSTTIPSSFDMIDGQQSRSLQTCGQQALLLFNHEFGDLIDGNSATPEIEWAINRQKMVNYLMQVYQHLDYYRQLSYKPVNTRVGMDLTRKRIPILDKWPAKVNSIGQLLDQGFTHLLVHVIRKIPSAILFKDEEMINIIVGLLALITSMVTQEDNFQDPDFILLEFYAGLIYECSDLNSTLSDVVFNTLCYAGNLLAIQPQAWISLFKRNFTSTLLNQAHQLASLMMKDSRADNQPFLLGLSWAMCNFFHGFETCPVAVDGLVTSPSDILSEAAVHIIPALGYFIQSPDVRCKAFILSTLKIFSSPESHNIKHIISHQHLIEIIVNHLNHSDPEIIIEASYILANISCYNECAQYLVTEFKYLSYLYHVKAHASLQLFTTLANISAGGDRAIKHIVDTHGLVDLIMDEMGYVEYQALHQIFIIMRNITNLGDESQVRMFLEAGLIPILGSRLGSPNLGSDTIKIALEVLDKIFNYNDHAGYQQFVRKQCQEGHLLGHLNALYNHSENQVLLTKIKKLLDYLDYKCNDDSINYDDPDLYSHISDPNSCYPVVNSSDHFPAQQQSYVFF